MSWTVCFELELLRFPRGVERALQKSSGGVHTMSGALGSTFPADHRMDRNPEKGCSGVLELC